MYIVFADRDRKGCLVQSSQSVKAKDVQSKIGYWKQWPYHYRGRFDQLPLNLLKGGDFAVCNRIYPRGL